MSLNRKHPGKHRHRERVISALLTTSTQTAAAELSGISLATIKRWLSKDPTFQAEINAARAAILQNTTNRLVTTSLAAAEVLYEIAKSPAASESSRVAASGKLLALAYQAGIISTIEERLQQLETVGGEEE